MRSPWPIRASRVSHSTASNGWVSAVLNRRLIDSSDPGVVSWVVVGWVIGFIGLPPLRFTGARDAYSKLLSGPGIVPRESDGKDGTALIILEGPGARRGSPATSAKFIGRDEPSR